MKVGDVIWFVPSFMACNYEYGAGGNRTYRREKIAGRVVEINRAKCWYRVELRLGGATLHECFKFIPAGRKAKKPYRPHPPLIMGSAK